MHVVGEGKSHAHNSLLDACAVRRLVVQEGGEQRQAAMMQQRVRRVDVCLQVSRVLAVLGSENTRDMSNKHNKAYR